METIPLKDCVKIGFLQKPHGVYGNMYLVFEEEYDEAIEEARIFFVKIDGLLVPFFTENDTPEIKSSKRALVKFRWVESEEKAREYSGCEVYLKKEGLNTTERPQLSNLNGFQVVNPDNIILGTIAGVENFSGNIVISLLHKGREILLPFNEALVEIIDHEQKRIKMKIPEGLLDMDEL